jgi:hypothetical protein
MFLTVFSRSPDYSLPNPAMKLGLLIAVRRGQWGQLATAAPLLWFRLCPLAVLALFFSNGSTANVIEFQIWHAQFDFDAT